MGEPIDAEINAALERGRIAKQGGPCARTCRYDVATKRVVVELANGCVFGFPARLGQGLERASDEQLAQVEILGGGSGLHWDALDADLSVPGLLAGLFGTRAYMAQQGGRATSAAKPEAARSNGRKGGRPRKTAQLAGKMADQARFHAIMDYGSQSYTATNVFKTGCSARFARRERIADGSLREAIDRAERGIVDADLGGGLIKQRVAREGRGRSGDYRMLVAWRAGGKAVFLYGFARNEQENIGPDEVASLREIAMAWLEADADRLADTVGAGELQEVEHGEDETQPVGGGNPRDRRRHAPHRHHE